MRWHQRWWTIARPIAWWGFSFWLLLMLLSSVIDIWQYPEDSTTYRQVYRNVGLQQLTAWIFAFLHVATVVAQARCWRARRFSPVALAVFGLTVCFGLVDQVFGIVETCCG